MAAAAMHPDCHQVIGSIKRSKPNPRCSSCLTNATELMLMVEMGMDPMKVIQAGMRNGAEALVVKGGVRYK